MEKVKPIMGRFSTIVIFFALPLIVGWVTAEGFFKPFQILMLLACFFFLLWLLVKPHIGVFAVIVLIFIPLSIGNLFKIPYLQVAEVAIPLITIVYFLSKILRREPIFVFRRNINPFLVPILLYFGVIFANYLRNPLPPSSILGIPQEMGGLRTYYRFFLCFCVYLLFAEAVSTDIKIVQGIKKFFWQISLILCLLGVILIYSYLGQNVLHGLQTQGIFPPSFFSTGGPELLETRYRLPSGASRIGTLGEMASVGLLLLLSGSKKISSLPKWLLYAFLWWILILLSGSRSISAGIILAFCLLMVIRKEWKFLSALIVLGFIIYMCVSAYYNILPVQLQRILKIRGSPEELDVIRAAYYPLYWKSAFIHPIIGVGMGSITVSGTGLDYVTSFQLRFGGQGTYLSLLYTTGLLGFIPFLWLYIGGMKTSFILFNQTSNKITKAFSLFCLLYLIYDLIPLGFGGNGANILFFMILGIISGQYIYSKFSHD